MQPPIVDVSITPLSTILPNVLDLPLVSRAVKMGIAAGVRFTHIYYYYYYFGGLTFCFILFMIDQNTRSTEEHDFELARVDGWD